MFDPQPLLARLGGDRALMRHLMEIYCEEAPRLADQIRAAITAGDWNRAEFAAHNLRGLAANLAETATMVEARRLEEASAAIHSSKSSPGEGGQLADPASADSPAACGPPGPRQLEAFELDRFDATIASSCRQFLDALQNES